MQHLAGSHCMDSDFEQRPIQKITPCTISPSLEFLLFSFSLFPKKRKRKKQKKKKKQKLSPTIPYPPPPKKIYVVSISLKNLHAIPSFAAVWESVFYKFSKEGLKLV